MNNEDLFAAINNLREIREDLDLAGGKRTLQRKQWRLLAITTIREAFDSEKIYSYQGDEDHENWKERCLKRLPKLRDDQLMGQLEGLVQRDDIISASMDRLGISREDVEEMLRYFY